MGHFFIFNELGGMLIDCGSKTMQVPPHIRITDISIQEKLSKEIPASVPGVPVIITSYVPLCICSLA